MKKLMIALLAITTLTALSACTKKAEAPTMDNSEASTEMSVEIGEADAEELVTFTITGENFKYIMDGQEAPELRVKEGDTVRIEFTSTDGFHDWVVDEFDAATEQVMTGDSSSVEFVASKKGIFEYYCSVGNHRDQGMTGMLVVE